jgi:hypothetical protein
MVPIYLALLAFLWEYEAAPTPFLLTLESVEAITGTQQVLVAGVVPNDCAGLPGATEDTFCTTIACPGIGRFRATVEAQGRRSNTITLRIRDHACSQVEGPEVLYGRSQGPPIPPGTPCRSMVNLPPAPVVTLDTPSLTELPRTVAIPRTEAPVIPQNPKVIAKVPHAAPPMTPSDPARVPMPPRGLTDPLPARPVLVPAGPPETRPVTLPAVAPPRGPCP